MTVEMLVAVAIVLLVGSVAIASLGNRHGSTLRSETAEISLLLQQARMEALESGQAVAIVWDGDKNTLNAGTRSHQLPDSLEVTAESAGTRLYPSGESGGFQLTLRNSAGSNTVSLNWLTGKVSRLQ